MGNATITVKLRDGKKVKHDADYFQHEDGWTTLKTVDGKQVAAYPDSLIKSLSTTLGPVTAAEQEEISAGATLADAQINSKTAARSQASAKYALHVSAAPFRGEDARDRAEAAAKIAAKLGLRS